jgi:hypothetical protein
MNTTFKRSERRKKAVMILTLVLLSLSVFVIIMIKSINLKTNCTGYLKRAADAGSVEIALKELTTAINYLEAHHMTSGYTSIVWNTPDEDVAFWYANLKASQSELIKASGQANALEQSNVLIKLRETLIDHGKEGEELTVPDGLSRHPNNLFWTIAIVLAAMILIVLILSTQKL